MGEWITCAQHQWGGPAALRMRTVYCAAGRKDGCEEQELEYGCQFPCEQYINRRMTPGYSEKHSLPLSCGPTPCRVHLGLLRI